MTGVQLILMGEKENDLSSRPLFDDRGTVV